MGHSNSSTYQKAIIPPNSYIQIPNQEGNSLTFLNTSNTDVFVKELPAPALTAYSFKDYNPASIEIPKPLSWQKLVGFGEISTTETGNGINKIFKSESIDKRLAVYTRLSDFTDKDNLELSFDFYNPSPKTSKITKMEINHLLPDVPLDWEWGTTYTTSGGGCYGGGIGMTLFENPDWNIRFTISNFVDLNNNLYFQQNQPNGKGFEGFRLVIYRPDSISEGVTSNYKYWSVRPTRTDYRAAQQELDIYVPLYKMAGIRALEPYFVCVEQLQNDKDICRITPFQKVVLRNRGSSNISLNTASQFVVDNDFVGSTPSISLDNIIREGNRFILNYRYSNFSSNHSTVQFSYDPNFATFTSNTNGPFNTRIQNIDSYQGNVPIYFRIQMGGNRSNVLAYDPRLRDSTNFTKGTYGAVCKNAGSSNDQEKYYAGISCPEIRAYNSTSSGSGFLNDVANISGIRSGTENGGALIRQMSDIRSNSSINLFAFANWASKPYPQNLPFKDNPSLGKDAYRISLDIYNNTVAVYHGSSTIKSSDTYLSQNNVHPYFSGSSDSVCNGISNIGINYLPVNWLGSGWIKNNDWNTFKVRFNKGVISAYLNKTSTNGPDRLLFQFNDPYYSSRNMGNYIGVTTTHNFPPDRLGRSPAVHPDALSGSYPGLPAELQVKNFKVNGSNFSNITDADVDSLSTELTLSSNSGLELDGISNANQFFLKNTSQASVEVMYRVTN